MKAGTGFPQDLADVMQIQSLSRMSFSHTLFGASRQFLILSFALRADSSYFLWCFAPISHSHFHGASRLSSSFFPIFLTLPNPIFNCFRHHVLVTSIINPVLFILGDPYPTRIQGSEFRSFWGILNWAISCCICRMNTIQSAMESWSLKFSTGQHVLTF